MIICAVDPIHPDNTSTVRPGEGDYSEVAFIVLLTPSMPPFNFLTWPQVTDLRTAYPQRTNSERSEFEHGHGRAPLHAVRAVLAPSPHAASTPHIHFAELIHHTPLLPPIAALMPSFLSVAMAGHNLGLHELLAQFEDVS
ncbi:hypothetical protein C0993_001967 [Termitomyces sp. T159_Od127]|nr:hypothetical protein C0993_001967 [Termitomyces sp. T159_Od127]